MSEYGLSVMYLRLRHPGIASTPQLTIESY